MENRSFHSLAVSATTRTSPWTLEGVRRMLCSRLHLTYWVGSTNSIPTLFFFKKRPLTVKRQDIFCSVGHPSSLIDRVVDFSQAAESYRAFDKGEIGKVIFDPWK